MVAERVATPRRVAKSALYGSATPRIAPPVPAADISELKAAAEAMGLTLMPAQLTAARYIEAKNRKGKHLYREVGIEWARQNGKTTIVKPYIVKALRQGKRILHIADKLDLPREMHAEISDALSDEPELFPKRRGKTIWPRFGKGQEEILLANGGRYRIASSRNSSARGKTIDIVIIDELREAEDFNIMSTASSTLATSPDPLTIYLSNEGDAKSVVLHSVKDRAGKDPNLAWLEWSADPEYTTDDRRGWVQANPGIGHLPALLDWLEAEYLKHKLAGTLEIFETENLCRSVPTLAPKIVSLRAWEGARGPVEPVRSPGLAFSMAPDGSRASAAIAWEQSDGRIALKIAEDTIGSPIDAKVVGEGLRKLRTQVKAVNVSYGAATDAVLAKHIKGAKPLDGQELAQASRHFQQLVDSGQLVWTDAERVSDDLPYAGRKNIDETGRWVAIQTSEQHPVTAVLAAIRATWLVSGTPRPRLRV